MIYTDLDRIPLRAFIDVFCGDIDAICKGGTHFPKEKAENAERLVNEYLLIIGGRSAGAQLYKKNEGFNNNLKIACMEACQGLIKDRRWEEACDILANMGYKLKPEEHVKIKQRIDSILGTIRLKIEREKAVANNQEAPKMDKDYFVRERVMVMSHFNMQIDPDRLSAKEYAFMVKRMCDDVSAINRSTKK